MPGPILRILLPIWNRMDSHSLHEDDPDLTGEDSSRWRLPIPFVLLNLSVAFVFLVGWSWIAIAIAVFLYFLRMFAITGCYHRYLSHRTYKTSRLFQFAFVFLGDTAAQRGPLWWAAHHRLHHRYTDQAEDPHSPILYGFWISHLFWWGQKKNLATRKSMVPDLCKFPELVFLDRFHFLGPLALALFTFALGLALQRWFPGLGTTGPQMLVWGFVISTVVLAHGIASINSLAHLVGRRRYATADNSRNSFWLALITMGEGWHNNHHHYPGSTRQGIYWWEIDFTYYGLRGLERLGLIWDLKPVPDRVRNSDRLSDAKRPRFALGPLGLLLRPHGGRSPGKRFRPGAQGQPAS
jgi:stearoyl-CoA desaturase (Delta-9 desaturase)